MIRTSTVLWSAAVIVVGYAMFQVKYEVQQQEEALARLDRQIVEGREAIRVLNAEWSFLTQPARLSELSQRYLKLAPISVAQIGNLDAIPLRDAAPPTPPAPPAPVAALPARPEPHAGATLATFEPSPHR
jgi:hypothetical protein